MRDPKTKYAQSSDIKARSYHQYRYDMKKKAIAELEFLPVLQDLLQPASVSKHGADKDLWFLRGGTESLFVFPLIYSKNNCNMEATIYK